MKKVFILFLFFSSFSNKAQYCMLPGQTPYSTLQPGITNFMLNTINRSSGNSESSSAVVVTTGQSTTLTAGQVYTVSITHSEDNQFFPGARNNLRVWIDYNNNFAYTDPGETVFSIDMQNPNTTTTGTFMIPASTPAGTLSLRATAKMSSDAGHSLPTPCNVPSDPLGYHGEMEDYEIVIQASSGGVSPVAAFALSNSVCVITAITPSNTSTGTPAPTYSWSASPSAGVTFSPSSTSSNPAISFSTAGSYTITCKATNSVSSNSAVKTISVSSCNFVGIAQNGSIRDVQISPNPASNRLDLRTPDELTGAGITVINGLGQIMIAQTILNNNTSLNVSALPDGVYFIRMNSNGKNYHQQIIISKE